MDEYYPEQDPKKFEPRISTMGKNWKKLDDDFEEKMETPNNYLRIWQVNPSYKDINSKLSNAKVVSLVFLTMFFIISTYLLTLSLSISMGVGILALVSFILVFHDSFYGFRNLFLFHARKFVSINPFEDFSFFFLRDDLRILFYANKKDLVNAATSVFKVDVIPENVKVEFNHFVRSLNERRLPYSFQVVHAPIISSRNNIRELNVESTSSFKTSIYFSTYHKINGVLTRGKIANLRDILVEYVEALKSYFSSNFYHFKISLLSGSDLIDAIRAFVLRTGTPNAKDTDYSLPRANASGAILKGLLCAFILGYSAYVLLQLSVELWMIALICITIFAVIILVWWRNSLFFFTKSTLRKDDDIIPLNPFKDVKTYIFRKIPDSVFFLVNDTVLIDAKMFNLKHADPHIMGKKPLSFPKKFYRGMTSSKIPFTYTVVAAPMSFYEFRKEGLKYLNSRAMHGLLNPKTGIKNEKEGEDWLSMRIGMWRAILTTSASSYKFVNSFKIKHAVELEEKLSVNATKLKNTFIGNFPSFELETLANKKLVSGYLLTSLKNKFFRLNGTHLNYLLFQGYSLVFLTMIADELRRGVDARIAAEFNTPLALENFITVGNTINTETLEEEVPVGFTVNQLNNLLIVNGTSESRKELTAKIVLELVKADVHSLVFDFTGEWSKLIEYFKNSMYENEFLYFKLGSAFSVDPLHSDIPYDKDNLNFLDYMFDACAMAFKKNDREMDTFKNTILRNPELDISELSLELKGLQEFEKNPSVDALTVLFDEFSQQDFAVFQTSGELDEARIDTRDFVDNNKTVVVDLSAVRDFDKKIYIAFLVVSKIIHRVQKIGEYFEKVIVMPNIDLFFDEFYLDHDKFMNYGKIDKFLNPLRQAGFGLIFTANQVRYLHPNVFNHFQNVVTFRANDKRDISSLSNRMNLEEFHGTGYFSNKRTTPYQVDYLMRMKDDEVIIKRSDVYQPFPAKIHYEDIREVSPMDYDEIAKYMNRHGYDLKSTQRRLLEQTKKTLFEKDLGSYAIYLKEIVKFLQAIKRLEDVGNLYEAKLKDELKKSIAKEAIKKVRTKRNVLRIRDELFDILLKHGYLVEHHPRTAGGSEALRSTYAVGSQYKKALEDYFRSKRNYLTDVSVEPIEKTSQANFDNIIEAVQKQEPEEFEELFEEVIVESPIQSFDDDGKFSDALAKEMLKMWNELYQIHRLINKKRYQQAATIEKGFVIKFLYSLYKEMYNVNYAVTNKDLKVFTKYLCNCKDFPFNEDELRYYLEQCSSIDPSEPNLASKVAKLYDLLSTFYNKIQINIVGEE